MKKIFFAILIAATAQAATAQEKVPATSDADKSITSPSMERKHHRGMKHDGMNKMKDLNLSEEQKTKLREQRTANKEKRDAIVNDSKLSDEQKKEQLSNLHKAQKDEMKSLLTDEQKAKMKELKAQRKAAKRAKSVTPPAQPTEQK